MKIIDAVWEKRNLGQSCSEFFLDDNDTPETVYAALQKQESDYMVVEVPVSHIEIHQVLTKCGYYFIETLFQIEKKLGASVLKKNQLEKASHMSYSIDAPGAKERVFAEIRAGMFTTDRITLDPYFEKNQGAIRYIGLLTDEFNRGAELMEFLYDGDPFGFACFRKSGEQTYYQSLTGIYSAYRGRGYGFALAYLPSKVLVERGAQTLTGAVSTNNTASLQAHLRTGFLPTDTRYIFVKHNPE